MRNIHSTTSNPTTYLRMLLGAALAFGIAILVPYAGTAALDHIAPRAVNLGILFSITVGFLMYKSINRRSEIDNYIALELNKIRRLYHLAQHIQRTTPTTDTWFAAVKGGIREYLGLFKTLSFHEYELGNSIFRSVTYAIYSLPKQAKKYPTELYQSLLAATADATLAREYIRANKDDQVSLFSWVVVTVVSLTFAVIITMATPPEPVLRFVGAAVIFCMFLVLQLIYEHDRSNPRRERAWAHRYVTDLESLDHAEKMK